MIDTVRLAKRTPIGRTAFPLLSFSFAAPAVADDSAPVYEGFFFEPYTFAGMSNDAGRHPDTVSQTRRDSQNGEINCSGMRPWISIGS